MSLSDLCDSARPTWSFSDCYVGWDECDPQALLYDSRSFTPGQAKAGWAREYGAFTDAKLSTKYCLWLLPHEIWEEGGGERWSDTDEGIEWAEAHPDADLPWPDDPPANWEPDPESDRTFMFVKRGTPDAVKVYEVEVPR